MNTKLTDEQKVLKALGIFMDAGMFMFSLVSGGESITAGVVIKSLLVEMVTGMSMVGATYYANVADLSFGQTMLLMMIVGTFTGLTANQAFDFVEDGVDNLIYNLKNSDCWDDIDFILNGDGSYHLKYDPRAEYDNYLNNKRIKTRMIDGSLDEEFLNNIDKIRSKLPTWAKNKLNFGYAEVDIDGIDKTQYFAHSSIQTEIPSVKGSGISVKPSSSPTIKYGDGAWQPAMPFANSKPKL